MLQLLIWGICVLIIGTGIIIQYLEKIAYAKEENKGLGIIWIIISLIPAVILFYLSIEQVNKVSNLFNH